MTKKISIGISDFKELIEDNCYFVDKTLLIEEFIKVSAKIVLVARPRRFGKTLNMSMLKYFFEKSSIDNINLFQGLNIEKNKDIMELQSKYPVIFLSFKDEKHLSFDNLEMSLRGRMSDIYIEHRYCLDNPNLHTAQKEYYNRVINKESNIIELGESLGKLSKYLYDYYNEKVIILIDEYDVPIQAGYVNQYYNEVIFFMRNFLSAAFKDNIYLEKAMITGILRVAKESIFSGLNNLEISSLLNYNFNTQFGFTEKEIEIILKDYNITTNLQEVKDWYNGYIFGEETIYNPWSILNYVSKPSEGLKPYWVNTSSNDLVNLLLAKGGEDIKKDLEILVEDKNITRCIIDNIVMEDIRKSSDNLWSFLLFTGYLKAYDKERIGLKDYYKLKIPNLEIKSLYIDIIENWFNNSISKDKYNMMLNSLTKGDIKTFGKILKQFVLNSISYFDVGGYEGEKVYHAFILGLLVSLNDTHEVVSNRESGYGRYDVSIIPKDKTKLGLVIEFKKLDVDDTETLEETADSALKQIEEKQYCAEIVSRGINKIKELAIVFKGKEIYVKEG
ncbi:AAA family ATPase [Clostridium grantii]|uniref:PD-(D/E)XK nuclease superfamily protein n=1 Tax=Clostridium grantii DSM 8605 TaxID=1121316 RepID=A0A1M5RJ09_9CLOT|nr:AAA family ATPase [Clostridium grantii]SHH26170.1 PD-(D/E)XK nuclease superfamily protein [Clostridium grantii DSM 8605]